LDERVQPVIADKSFSGSQHLDVFEKFVQKIGTGAEK
jgi:hypothetical protein